MNRFLKLTALGAVVAASSAFAASFTILNATQTVGTSVSLTAGAGQTKYTDNFNGNSATFTNFTLTGGVQGGDIRQFQSGSWFDQVDQTPATGAPETTTITLNPTTVGAGNSIYGFAGNFNVGYGGDGSDLRITVTFADNTTAIIAGTGGVTGSLNQNGGIFGWGFTSDTAITSVTISADTNAANWEAYVLDDVQLLTAGGTGGGGGGGGGGAVPEPSSFGLMGLAMVGLGAIRKVRK